jgi:hypothetical protein
MQSTGDSWSAFTPVSEPWPTLSSDLTVAIESVAQRHVVVSLKPALTSWIGLECCTAKVTESFGSKCSVKVGEIVVNVVVGYATWSLRNAIGNTMTIETVDGTIKSNDCMTRQLERCTEYKFKCRAQNTAGWSTPVPSQAVTTLPDLPPKAPKPQINQLGADGDVLADRFTILLEAPPDTATSGGTCSEYSFRVQVKSSAGVLITNSSGESVGELVVSGLSASTTYSVIVQAHNQAGWGDSSDALEVWCAH